MSAFLFSDLHCNNMQLANLSDFVVQHKEIEALIFAGDVVNMGEPVWFMEKFIKVIDELKLPFLWVPGNNDFGRAYYKLNAKYKSLEGKVTVLSVIPAKAGIQALDPRIKSEDDEHYIRRFTGVGGSPASWAGQYEGESMVDKKAIANSIFVSHVPPPANIILNQYDIGNPKSEILNPKQITNPNDQNLKQFGKFENSDLDIVSNLELRASNLPKGRRLSDVPLVHICGHLHSRFGTAFLGKTKVIQLASLETGHYAILDLETLVVKFERF